MPNTSKPKYYYVSGIIQEKNSWAGIPPAQLLNWITKSEKDVR
jgi:hypothetical protein